MSEQPMEPVKPTAGTGQMKRLTGRPDPMLDRTISSYRMVRKIGQGGMGAVYEAKNTSDEARVAIKVLLRKTLDDPNASRRFFNEAKAISMVSHPCLVKIFEYGNCPTEDGSEGEAYIVMEYLDGETLRARLAKRYLGGSCLGLMRQMASALAATHKRRIVHRDLKPDNIMLVRDPSVAGGERVKILDFGIAKLLPEAGTPEAAADMSDSTQPDLGVPGMARTVKTRTGMPIGTPAYMSPEQCRASAPPDEKTDVYSIGVIFYEMLYGEPPFNSDSAGEMYALQMFGTPPPLDQRAPGVNPQLVALIHRMLDKKPSERPSMEDLLRELERIADSGKVDGPIDLRPSEHTAGTPLDQSVSSGVLRDQVNERVRATDKLALVHAPTLPQQTTGVGSLGEQVAVGRRSWRSVAALSAGAVVVLLAGGVGWVLRRPNPPTPVAVVTPPTPVPVAAPPPTTPAPVPAAPAPAPPPSVDGDEDPDAGKSAGKGKSTAKNSRKSVKKPAKAPKKDKLKIDLWK